MAEETFSDLGRIGAIEKLYEGTQYHPFESSWFETDSKSYIGSHSRLFIEGIDFDLTYFPLKHLGYKCVTAVTSGEAFDEEKWALQVNETIKVQSYYMVALGTYRNNGSSLGSFNLNANNALSNSNGNNWRSRLYLKTRME